MINISGNESKRLTKSKRPSDEFTFEVGLNHDGQSDHANDEVIGKRIEFLEKSDKVSVIC